MKLIAIPIFVILFIGCSTNQEETLPQAVEKILSHDDSIDEKHIAKLIVQNDFPYLIVRDTFIGNEIQFSTPRIINKNENVLRDLGAFSICIKEDHFFYFNEEFEKSQYDSLLNAYFIDKRNTDNPYSNTVLLQIMVDKDYLTKNTLSTVFSFVSNYHKLFNAYSSALINKNNRAISVIGFDFKCQTYEVEEPIEPELLNGG